MNRLIASLRASRAVTEWWLLVSVLALWAVASVFGWIPREDFPDLQSLAKVAYQLTFGDGGVLGSLGGHIAASAYRFAVGYALSVVVGLGLGLIMGMNTVAAALMVPILRFLYPIPGLAWTPLVILWCGLGEKAVIMLIFLSAVWPVLYGAYDGFRNIPTRYLSVARQLEAGWTVRVRKVLIPAALPILVSALRIAHGVGWRAIVGAEMIAALSGLGFMLNLGGELRRPEVVVLGMVVIAIISVCFDRIFFQPLEKGLAKKRLR
jgi:taurine transport system permease protein